MGSTRNNNKSRQRKRRRLQAWVLLLLLAALLTGSVGLMAHQLDRWFHAESAWGADGLDAATFHVPAPAFEAAFDDVAMRASPNLDSEVLARLRQGTDLKLIDASSGWLRVQTEEHGSGWVEGESVQFLGASMHVSDGLWTVEEPRMSSGLRISPSLTVKRIRPGVMSIVWEGNGVPSSVVPSPENNALVIPFQSASRAGDAQGDDAPASPDPVSWHVPVGDGGIVYVTVREAGIWIQGEHVPGYRVVELAQNRVELELMPEVTGVHPYSALDRSGIRFALRGKAEPRLEKAGPNELRLIFPGARWAVEEEGTVSKDEPSSPQLPAGWVWERDVKDGVAITFPVQGRTVMKQKAGEVRIEMLKPGLKGKRIVIDPGHGGDDGGAIGLDGTEERELNLAVSQLLKELLEQRGAEVLLLRRNAGWVAGEEELSMATTPSGLIALDLEARVRRANEADADLFLSIHHNGGLASYNGVETFYSEENVNAIASLHLASILQEELVAVSNMQDRGTHEFPYYVLRTTQAPSALVELGFITHASDWAKLKEPSFQRLEAEALLRGIESFLNP